MMVARMKLAFNVVDWQACAPGLAEPGQWLAWSQQTPAIDAASKIAKSLFLPMMTARRLASGSRLAVDCALAMLARAKVDALVFASRHGELERNFRILTALAEQHTVSPTDFAMSVHNSAVGNVTIAAKMPYVSSSVCAGRDTFGQALVEVASLHFAGYKRVLMVDFDGVLPDFYQPFLDHEKNNFPFAVALLLEAGSQMQVTSLPSLPNIDVSLPQSLMFLHAWLSGIPNFTLSGERLRWQWERG